MAADQPVRSQTPTARIQNCFLPLANFSIAMNAGRLHSMSRRQVPRNTRGWTARFTRWPASRHPSSRREEISMSGIRVYAADLTRQSSKYRLYGRRHDQVNITLYPNIAAPNRGGPAFFGSGVISMVILSSGRMLLTLVCEEGSYFSLLNSLRNRTSQRSWSVTCSHADPVGLTSVLVAGQLVCTRLNRAKTKSNFLAPNFANARIVPAKRRSRIRLTAQQR